MNTFRITKAVNMYQKIDLYMRVFGEAPWNEGYICTVTGKLFPL